MLLKLFLASVTVLFATADDTAVLNCDTLTGDLRWKMIRFSRAMEVGDRLTVTGTVYSSANMSYLHLYQGFQNKYEDGIVSLHIRAQYERNSIIYNSFLDRTNWGREEFGPLPYRKATKYTITVVKQLNKYDVYNGNTLIKTFAIRHPLDWQIGNLLIYGDWSAEAVSMLCVRAAETTTAAPTTDKGKNPISDDEGSLSGGDIVHDNGSATTKKSGNSYSGNGNSGNNHSGNYNNGHRKPNRDTSEDCDSESSNSFQVSYEDEDCDCDE